MKTRLDQLREAVHATSLDGLSLDGARVIIESDALLMLSLIDAAKAWDHACTMQSLVCREESISHFVKMKAMRELADTQRELREQIDKWTEPVQ